MNRVSPISLGFGFALASSALYIVCVVLMAILDRSTAIAFFNSLSHGLDVEPIYRTSIGFLECILGLVATFIMAGLYGMVVGFGYNICRCGKKEQG